MQATRRLAAVALSALSFRCRARVRAAYPAKAVHRDHIVLRAVPPTSSAAWCAELSSMGASGGGKRRRAVHHRRRGVSKAAPDGITTAIDSSAPRGFPAIYATAIETLKISTDIGRSRAATAGALPGRRPIRGRTWSPRRKPSGQINFRLGQRRRGTHLQLESSNSTGAMSPTFL